MYNMSRMDFYESLFKNNSDLIFIVDSNGIILDANPIAQEITGYNLDEIKYICLDSLLLDYENEQNFHHLILNNSDRADIRVELKILNDDAIGCLLKSVPFYEDGLIKGYFIVLKDMRELDKVVDQLIPSPYNYKSITENVLDVIIIMDEQKNYLYVSPSSKEVFEFDYENMNDYEAYFNIHPDSVPLLNESFESTLTTGEPFDIDVQAHHSVRGWIWTKILGKAVYDDKQKFKHMFLIARDISKEKERENELKFFAYHDSLTSIPNRRYLWEHLPKLIQHKNDTENPFAIVLLDIDDFKYINDSYGHEIGDAIIQEFASRLQQLVIDKGIVARLGGDEFVLLLDDLNVVNNIHQFEQLIHQSMQAPFTVQATHLNVTTSIGITLCDRKGLTNSIIFQTVDKALYEGKRNGKNKTVINIIKD